MVSYRQMSSAEREKYTQDSIIERDKKDVEAKKRRKIMKYKVASHFDRNLHEPNANIANVLR